MPNQPWQRSQRGQDLTCHKLFLSNLFSMDSWLAQKAWILKYQGIQLSGYLITGYLAIKKSLHIQLFGYLCIRISHLYPALIVIHGCSMLLEHHNCLCQTFLVYGYLTRQKDLDFEVSVYPTIQKYPISNYPDIQLSHLYPALIVIHGCSMLLATSRLFVSNSNRQEMAHLSE